MNKEQIIEFLNDPVHNLASFWYLYTKTADKHNKGAKLSYNSLNKKADQNNKQYSFKDTEIDILKIAISEHLKKYNHG